jgi:hypothetical protein
MPLVWKRAATGALVAFLPEAAAPKYGTPMQPGVKVAETKVVMDQVNNTAEERHGPDDLCSRQ